MSTIFFDNVKKQVYNATMWARLRFVTTLTSITLVGGRVWTGTTCYVGNGAIGVACPLGVAQLFAATGSFVPALALAGVFGILLTVFFGRGFCGWICPGRWLFNHAPTTAAKPLAARPLIQTVIVGGVIGLAALFHLAPTTAAKPLAARPLIQTVIVGGVIGLAALFHLPLFCLICPAGVICRGVGTIGIGGNPLTAVGWLSAVMSVEWASGRSWCRDLCPLGAAISRLSVFNPFLKVKSNQEICRPCLACQKSCSEGINLSRASDLSTCTKCFACVSACPRGGVEIKLW
ncbi:MAG: 4Fe-4S binding protein [Chloroflexi bacterium]|nr:4Fe-4S binding protein [Chloroflexota bacterium]